MKATKATTASRASKAVTALAVAAAMLPASRVLAAQPLALPDAPQAQVVQHIGAHVPLDVAVMDESGVARHLSDFVDGSRPVLLVPGYYRCPQLCGLLTRGLLDSLHESHVQQDSYRIVRVSIDPRETPADARVRREVDVSYANLLAKERPAGAPAGPTGLPEMHLLTLEPGELARITSAIGFHFEQVPDAAAPIAHPATVVILTPRGDVARYFNGIGIDAGELRVALADAAGDRLGAVSTRIALLCAHFDPRAGRLDNTVMNGLRGGSAVLVMALGGWCWRRRKGARR